MMCINYSVLTQQLQHYRFIFNQFNATIAAMSEARLPLCVEFVPLERCNQVEGLCRHAPGAWAGFLGASEFLGIKPPLVELRTDDGEYLGIALQKDPAAIRKHPSEKNNPTEFGVQSFLIVEPAFSELSNALVVRNGTGKFLTRPFTSVADSIAIMYKDDREDEQLQAPRKRFDGVLASMELATEELAPKFGRTPSPDEVFEHALRWALQ
jgi:hypothetical protein